MDLHRTSLLQGFANGACLCLAFASQLHGTRDGDGTLCCSLSAGTGLDTASLRLPRCTWSLEYQYIGSRRFHSSRDRRGRVRLLSFLGSWACPLKGLPSCWHPTEPVPAESSPELQKRDALNNCGPLRGCTKLRSAAVAAAALPFAPSWPCLALPGPAWPAPAPSAASLGAPVPARLHVPRCHMWKRRAPSARSRLLLWLWLPLCPSPPSAEDLRGSL